MARGEFPGMGGNMGNMMKQMQKMVKKMEEMEKQIQETVEGKPVQVEAVTCKVNGKKEVLEIVIIDEKCSRSKM